LSTFESYFSSEHKQGFEYCFKNSYSLDSDPAYPTWKALKHLVSGVGGSILSPTISASTSASTAIPEILEVIFVPQTLDVIGTPANSRTSGIDISETTTPTTDVIDIPPVVIIPPIITTDIISIPVSITTAVTFESASAVDVNLPPELIRASPTSKTVADVNSLTSSPLVDVTVTPSRNSGENLTATSEEFPFNNASAPNDSDDDILSYPQTVIRKESKGKGVKPHYFLITSDTAYAAKMKDIFDKEKAQKEKEQRLEVRLIKKQEKQMAEQNKEKMTSKKKKLIKKNNTKVKTAPTGNGTGTKDNTPCETCGDIFRNDMTGRSWISYSVKAWNV